MTCSVKNLVGINTYKNWLPHFNKGTPAEGGDQFADSSTRRRLETTLLSRLKRLMTVRPELAWAFGSLRFVGKWVFGDTRNTPRSGNWYGNDPLWRMVLDLNKILLYANPSGEIRSASSPKRYLSIVDGVVAGQGDGPEAPTPFEAGMIAAGTNPLAVDLVCARLMGLDWRRIPCLSRAFNIRHLRTCDWEYDDVRIVSQDSAWNGLLTQISPDACYRFRPHFGWIGQVEI